MAWEVLLHPEAAVELAKLPAREKFAMDTAIEKLREIGQGRSPWRAFYREVKGELVVAAIAPEASVDQRGFTRAVGLAVSRLDELEED